MFWLKWLINFISMCICQGQKAPSVFDFWNRLPKTNLSMFWNLILTDKCVSKSTLQSVSYNAAGAVSKFKTSTAASHPHVAPSELTQTKQWPSVELQCLCITKSIEEWYAPIDVLEFQFVKKNIFDPKINKYSTKGGQGGSPFYDVISQEIFNFTKYGFHYIVTIKWPPPQRIAPSKYLHRNMY